MSDPTTPPAKPKPGSLRDRIAAFEKPAAAGAPGPAPAPRPKPGGLSWKPRPPSPPSSPSGTEQAAPTERKTGGMSAMDAKESIGKGVSLKERMAALQNKGGFGSPPPLAPKPALEKPKWKPPPVVAPVDKDEDELPPLARGDSSKSVEDEPAKDIAEEGPKPAIEGEEQTEPDQEDEERQRRAAIAARMARLGGARVGVAPVFGKPTVKRPEPKEETFVSTSSKDKAEDELDLSPPTEVTPEGHPSPPDAERPSDRGPQRKNSESASLVSVESEPQTSRSPNSMPLPSAPRRAGPPRKKPIKSPQETPALDEVVTSTESLEVTATPGTSDDASTKILEGGHEGQESVENDKAEVGSVTVDDKVPLKVEEEAHAAVEHFEEEALTEHVPAPNDEKEDQGDNIEPEQEDLSKKHSGIVPPSDIEPPFIDSSSRSPETMKSTDVPTAQAAAEETDEDEEAARRKRVAEKMAKMGGINPFAPPPQRKTSVSSAEFQMSPPVSPILQKRTSISRENSSSRPPPRKDSIRKSSVDSTTMLEEGLAPSSPISPTQSKVASIESPTSEIVPDSSSRKKVQDDSHVDSSAGPSEGIPGELELDDIEEENQIYHKESEINEGNLMPHTNKEKYSTEQFLEDNLATSAITSAISPPPVVPHPSTRPVINQGIPVDPALVIDPVPLPPPSLPQIPPHPASSPERSLPRLVSQPNDVEDLSDSESENISQKHMSMSQQTSDGDDAVPHRILPLRRVPSEENTDNESPPLPVPNRRSLSQDDGVTHLNTSYTTSRPIRSIPAPPPLPASTSDAEFEQESDHDEALPTRPRHRPDTPSTPPPNETPLIVPPPTFEDFQRKPEPSPLRQTSYPPPQQPDSATASSENLSPNHLTPTLSVSEQEILDEEEGDPIDPAFHVPSRRTSTANLPAANTPPSQEPVADSEEDAEQVRRRTIADRMAKLGGIKFGAAPLPTRPPPTLPRDEPIEASDSHAEEQVDQFEEEERARKERIAAKLAGMGGMRIGMLPLGVGGIRPQQSHVLKEEDTPPVASAPMSPTRAVPPRPPPPPPPPQAPDSDAELSTSQYSLSASDEGVKVEAEESEIEEVKHEDAEEEQETPPPVPPRVARRGTSESESLRTPVVPPVRPPVPTSLPSRKSSILTTSTARKSSVDSSLSSRDPPVQKPQTDFVIVEDPKGFTTEDIPPPPPPHRPTSRAPPSRGAPLPPVDPADSISSHWELPSIPSSSLELGPDADLSLSWSEGLSSDSVPPSPPPPPPPPHRQSARQTSHVPPVELSSDDLMAVWGRVGVQICEAATSLFDKSKKSLVGDGTYTGFVNAVLSEVPNAAPPSPLSYGYVIYMQNGGSVQKRASEILPGDIVELQDAKFKGHKGIHMYNQHVGVGGPLFGVISEFEPKKSKLRVFQANQHVGQQTVETVSYRLEDLKSGAVKIFRVLEG